MLVGKLDGLAARSGILGRSLAPLVGDVIALALVIGRVPALCVEVGDVYCLGSILARGEDDACGVLGNLRSVVYAAVFRVALTGHCNARERGVLAAARCPCVYIDGAPVVLVGELDNLFAADLKSPVQRGINGLAAFILLCVSAVDEPALMAEISNVGGLGSSIRPACRKEVTLNIFGNRCRVVVDSGINAIFPVIVHQHTRPLHSAAAAPCVNINAGPLQVIGEPYRHIIDRRIGRSLRSGSNRGRRYGCRRYGCRRLGGFRGCRSNRGRRYGSRSNRGGSLSGFGSGCGLYVRILLYVVVEFACVNSGSGIGGKNIDVGANNLGVIDDIVVRLGIAVAELENLNVEIDLRFTLCARLGLEGYGNKCFSVAVVCRLDTIGNRSVASDAAALNIGGIGVDNGVLAVCQAENKIVGNL